MIPALHPIPSASGDDDWALVLIRLNDGAGHGLGAELIHRPQPNTDQLGSFCGTVARRGSTRAVCLAKAELALRDADADLAIASEGSFGPHPALPLLPVGLECMVFLDAGRGLTISEELLAPRTNFAHRWLERSAVAPGVGADGKGHGLLRKGIHSLAGNP